jgi:N-acylneuraminate cytidylyltransferase
METIAIIPARGGSKRIPRKNVKRFAGLPLIVHSIQAAIGSGVFDRVIVSTDDDEIAAVACENGGEVPFWRPPELADDHTTTDQVLQHAFGWLADHGTVPEFACCLYATALFVLPEDLRNGLDLLRQKDATTAFSVTTFPFPILRALRINVRGRVEMFWPEHRLTRSQDLPEAWHDAGQFYWMNVAKYMKELRLFSSDSVGVPLPRWRVQDIDTPEDWERAEKLYSIIQAVKTEGQPT